jgi:lambda family phage portal protein
MAPATVDELDPGQEFSGFDPTHPSDAFDPFMKTLLRGVSRGLHMSYQTLSGDVSDASYSNTRSGLIPERDHWKGLQRTEARRFHRTTYRDWIAMALLTGAVRLPSSVARDYYAVEWQGRRWQWVDPANDLEAAEREIKLGLTSRQRLAAERGHDFETVVDESKADVEYAKSAGVYVGGVDTPPAARNQNTNGNGGGRTPASRFATYVEE